PHPSGKRFRWAGQPRLCVNAYSAGAIADGASMPTRRRSQTSRNRLGRQANVASRKNGIQLNWSTNQPLGAARKRAGTAASDENSAYFVAVNAALHRLDR